MLNAPCVVVRLLASWGVVLLRLLPQVLESKRGDDGGCVGHLSCTLMVVMFVVGWIRVGLLPTTAPHISALGRLSGVSALAQNAQGATVTLNLLTQP